MKQWVKVICAVLVLGMFLSVFPAPTQAQASENEAETVDFMLVVDASKSLFKSDPEKMALAACKMFIDMIPFENARVGVIVFGYNDSESYVYRGDYGTITDKRRVKQIFALNQTATLERKEEIKDSVEQYITTKHKSNADTLTPMGAAMLAAVDALEYNKATPGNACVILLTDGRMAFSSGVHERQSVNTALGIATTNQWPVYSIEMDYDNENDSWDSEWDARPLLDRIAKETGGSREEVSSASDISNAFLKIFNRFVFGKSGTVHNLKTNADGMVEHIVEIPNLTSETTIVVSGKNVTKIEVVNPQGNVREITGNVDEVNIIASMEPNKYTCMKLVCPAPGSWTIRAYGDPDATVTMYDCSMKDVDLNLVSDPVLDPAKALLKNDKVFLSSYFTYRDIPILTNDFYNQKQPVIEITNLTTNKMYEFEMGYDDNGYTYNMVMSKLGAGEYSARVRLDDDMFRNGRKFSNTIMFAIENVVPIVIKDQINAVKGYVNSTYPEIDLAQYLNNPDGDELTYELVCVSNRNLIFNYEVNENGYLAIQTGTVPGVHSLELSVKDPDMKEPLVLKLEATVENREPIVDDKLRVDLLLEPLPLVQKLNDVAQLNIRDFCSDPDGLEVVCVSVSSDNEDAVRVTTDGEAINIQALQAGKATVTFVISDQVTEVTATVRVHVASGIAEFMAENWWKMLAIAIVIFISVLLLIFRAKGTRVKGYWTLHVRINDAQYPEEQPAAVNLEWTSYGKKKEFPLVTMLNDQLPRIIEDDNSDKWPEFFPSSNKELSKITMKGVWLGSGCVLANVPKKSGITVRYAGREVTGNVRVNCNTVIMTVENGGDTLVLNLRHSTSRR